MMLTFWKMNGTGNDFVVLDDRVRRLADAVLPALARQLCARRYGAGADGLMVVRPAEHGGDYAMRFYNADGSTGAMCGNGARCLCRYAYEMGLAGEIQKIETPAGLVTGRRLDAVHYRVQLNLPRNIRLGMPLHLRGMPQVCDFMEIGVPHAAVFYPGMNSTGENTLRRAAQRVRFYRGFANGANVDLYEPAGKNAYRVRTYERGVEDFTLACGTGAGAVAAAGVLRRQTDGQNVRIEMPGGVLWVNAVRSGDTITALYLTGETSMVYQGVTEMT